MAVVGRSVRLPLVPHYDNYGVVRIQIVLSAGAVFGFGDNAR